MLEVGAWSGATSLPRRCKKMRVVRRYYSGGEVAAMSPLRHLRLFGRGLPAYSERPGKPTHNAMVCCALLIASVCGRSRKIRLKMVTWLHDFSGSHVLREAASNGKRPEGAMLTWEDSPYAHRCVPFAEGLLA